MKKSLKKKILFISGSGNTFVWFRLELMKEIQLQGYEVFAIAPEIDKENLEVLSREGIKFVEFGLQRKSLNIFNFFLSILQLSKIIKAIKPTHIFAYMHKYILITGLTTMFLRKIKIFYMVTGLGHLFERNTFLMKSLKKISLSFFRISFHGSERVFFQNPDDLNKFIELKLVTLQKSFLVNGSGVNLERFKPTKLPDDPVFMTMGRLLESKGLREFAEAASIVRKSFPNAKFILYGYPDNHNDSINENEIKDNWLLDFGIEYKGFSKDPSIAISECSVFVLLSYREGTPRSSLEAMAMGRPIITTDVPGCRETVVTGKNGFLVSVKNPFAAAEAMIKLCDPKIRELMGQESLKIAIEKFDVNKVNKSILSAMD